MKRIFLAFFVILLAAAGFAAFRYQQDRAFASTPFGSGTHVVTIAQ